MQMQRPHSNRASVIVGAFCFLLATILSGCASKNPLMEEPTTVAAAATPHAAPASAPTAAAPAKDETAVEEKKPDVAVASPAETVATDAPHTAPAPAPAVAPAPQASAATGVQTKREKRFLGFFSPYRPDVQQGNFVSQEMVAQLKEGMTPDQVTFLLGTPLLTDIFHAERWDYAFRMQKGNGEITTSHVTVFFKDNVVSHFEGGGDLPTEADYLARIANKAKAAK